MKTKSSFNEDVIFEKDEDDEDFLDDTEVQPKV